MPPAVLYLRSRVAAVGVRDWQFAGGVALVIALHAAAALIMYETEADLVAKAAFVLTWGVLNFLMLAVLRRPVVAAGLSLAMIVVLIKLSQLKHGVLFMTVNFVDLMIIDIDTVAFLLTVYPGLRLAVGIAVASAVPLSLVAWWFDPLRVRLRTAAVGCFACLAGLTVLANAAPSDPYEEFYRYGYVSKFGRSGITAVGDYLTRGLFEADAAASERLGVAAGDSCRPAARPPHIIMVHDESSFDLTAAPGIVAPPGYRDHFASFDGKKRSLVVEGAGGPSVFTEYNVLTGLSARSYGRFAEFLTRIAAGRVERGLPNALRRCGYRTFSLFPFLGAFLSARRFQTTTGIEHFYDIEQYYSSGVEPDSFYYDNAVKLIARERGAAPMFVLVYNAANHFPWTHHYRPDLTPEGWRDPGNGLEADEYLRRQAISAREYRDFIARLEREVAGEPVLIVRFGDHQPSFARNLIDPGFDDSALSRRIADHDPRFLTTYYTIEALNFRPADVSSALDTLDAPYLPLVVLEAAGMPLDPSFAEQKAILQRCHGMFYRCAGGAEARRFNRLLIDAGLIKGF
jgi:sulfatase-like protein